MFVEKTSLQFSTVLLFKNLSPSKPFKAFQSPEPRVHQVSRFPYRLRMQQRCEFRVHENFRQKLNRSQGAVWEEEMEMMERSTRRCTPNRGPGALQK